MEENNLFQREGINFCNSFKKYLETNKLIDQYLERKTVNTIKEIFIIVNRIHDDINGLKYSIELTDKIYKETHQGFIPESLDIIYCYYSLILDTKSFFIFVRILLDNIAKIIKLTSKKNNLPDSMSDLIKKIEKYSCLNQNVKEILLNKLSWFISFKEERDNIVHKLELLRIDYLLKPQFKFNNDDKYYDIIEYIKLRENQLCDLLIDINQTLFK